MGNLKKGQIFSFRLKFCDVTGRSYLMSRRKTLKRKDIQIEFLLQPNQGRLLSFLYKKCREMNSSNLSIVRYVISMYEYIKFHKLIDRIVFRSRYCVYEENKLVFNFSTNIKEKMKSKTDSQTFPFINVKID